ncbi:hypothetical protein [Arachidicoccus soli]|jgi:hypothetical protein|uniref:Lipoprotein n=1 Tax=Arachidicoccus soli TaxID=2341117 RepID=A0A386HM70_9BACT|nr:hypothetical protein [Arachidicoccus soli]AYD46772.1 hypothetical protein D6B99_03565 [Arachidicoccus soli]
MKKTLFAFAALIGCGLLFGSCTKTVHDNNSGLEALTTTFSLNQSSWTKNSNGNYSVTKTITDITSDITDYGAVWIYLSYDGGNTYELLPSNGVVDDNNNSYDFIGSSGDNNDGSAGFVNLYAYTSTTSPAPNMAIKVKVVSIPSSLSQSSASVDFKNYNEVKRVFNLK